jgi:hypothetical protein
MSTCRNFETLPRRWGRASSAQSGWSSRLSSRPVRPGNMHQMKYAAKVPERRQAVLGQVMVDG